MAVSSGSSGTKYGDWIQTRCLAASPPGYSGTTLLATAVERVSRAAWVSLDAADSPASFTARLLTALGAPTRVTSDGAVGQAQLLLDALSRTGPLFVVIADLDPATHAALLPVLYPVLERSIGAGWAAFTIGAGIVGSAILTRLLSVPEVEAFLQQTIPVLASQPKPKEPTDD